MGVRLGFASQVDGSSVTQANPIDLDCQITLASGAGLLQGQPLCVNIQAFGPSAASPTVFVVVPANNASAGPPLGIYQGASFTNSPGAAGGSVTYDITARAYGFGQILAGGATTSVTIGGMLAVKPAVSTAAVQAVNAENVLVQSAVYYVAAVIATPGISSTVAIGTVLVASTTAPNGVLVNALINTIG